MMDLFFCPRYFWFYQQENKLQLFGNIKNFTCKCSKYSISLVIAGLMEAAVQLGCAVEAREAVLLAKSTVEEKKPLLSTSCLCSPDARSFVMQLILLHSTKAV